MTWFVRLVLRRPLLSPGARRGARSIAVGRGGKPERVGPTIPLSSPARHKPNELRCKRCCHRATAIVLQPSRPSAVAAAGDAAAASAGADGAPAGAAVGAAACSCCFATLLRRLSSRSTATDLFQATSLRLSSPQGAQRSVPKQQPWHRIYFIATRRCCQRGTHTNGTAYPRGTLYVRTQVSHTHT